MRATSKDYQNYAGIVFDCYEPIRKEIRVPKVFIGDVAVYFEIEIKVTEFPMEMNLDKTIRQLRRRIYKKISID